MTFDPSWIDQEANVNSFWNGLLHVVFTHSYLSAMGSNSYIIAPGGKSPDSSRPLRADFLISRIVRRNLSGTPALIPASITEVTPILHFERKGNNTHGMARVSQQFIVSIKCSSRGQQKTVSSINWTYSNLFISSRVSRKLRNYQGEDTHQVTHLPLTCLSCPLPKTLLFYMFRPNQQAQQMGNCLIT